MGEFISNGKISIGYNTITSIRKKPCICVNEGNSYYILGTFKNEADAKFFVEKLAELTVAESEV